MYRSSGNKSTLVFACAKSTFYHDAALFLMTYFFHDNIQLYEPCCKKTGFSHMRKQRRRSASRLLPRS